MSNLVSLAPPPLLPMLPFLSTKMLETNVLNYLQPIPALVGDVVGAIDEDYLSSCISEIETETSRQVYMRWQRMVHSHLTYASYGVLPTAIRTSILEMPVLI
jgi:hypothetical protein